MNNFLKKIKRSLGNSNVNSSQVSREPFDYHSYGQPNEEPIHLGEVVNEDFKSKFKKPLPFYSKQRFQGTHIIGQAGRGKTRYIQYLAKQDILKGNGVCVIDYHGDLYKNMRNFCINQGLEKKLVLLDPSDSSHVLGFNPITFQNLNGKKNWSVHTRSLVDTINFVSGDSERITVKIWLFKVLCVLVRLNLPFEKALDLTDTSYNEFRASIIQKIDIPRLKKAFLDLEENQKFEQSFGASHRMLERFFEVDYIREMFRQENTINFSDIMDNQKIFLVNLSTASDDLSEDGSSLIGSLLVTYFYNFAKKRGMIDESLRKPFFVYIDEFYNFLTPNIGKALNELRKYSFSYILIHQNLQQLVDKDRASANAVIQDAQHKIIFGHAPEKDSDWFFNSILYPFVYQKEQEEIEAQNKLIADENRKIRAYNASKDKAIEEIDQQIKKLQKDIDKLKKESRKITEALRSHSITKLEAQSEMLFEGRKAIEFGQKITNKELGFKRQKYKAMLKHKRDGFGSVNYDLHNVNIEATKFSRKANDQLQEIRAEQLAIRRWQVHITKEEKGLEFTKEDIEEQINLIFDYIKELKEEQKLIVQEKERFIDPITRLDKNYRAIVKNKLFHIPMRHACVCIQDRENMGYHWVRVPNVADEYVNDSDLASSFEKIEQYHSYFVPTSLHTKSGKTSRSSKYPMLEPQEEVEMPFDDELLEDPDNWCDDLI